MSAEELLEEVAGRLWQVNTRHNASAKRLHEEVAEIRRFVEHEMERRRLGIGVTAVAK